MAPDEAQHQLGEVLGHLVAGAVGDHGQGHLPLVGGPEGRFSVDVPIGLAR